MSWLFGTIAGILSLLAYVPYILSIFKKKGGTVPSRTTWLILWSLSLVALVTYKESGAAESLWFAVGECLGSFLIASISIKMGTGGTEKLDVYCALGAVGSLVAWWLFESPAIALVTVLLIDWVAIVPTIRKTISNPDQEDTLAWSLTCTACALTLYSLSDEWNFSLWAYPTSLGVSSGLIAYLSTRKAPIVR